MLKTLRLFVGHISLASRTRFLDVLEVKSTETSEILLQSNIKNRTIKIEYNWRKSN